MLTTSAQSPTIRNTPDNIGCSIKTVFIYEKTIPKKEPSEGKVAILLYKKLEKQSHKNRAIRHIQPLLRKEDLLTKLFTFMQL